MSNVLHAEYWSTRPRSMLTKCFYLFLSLSLSHALSIYLSRSRSLADLSLYMLPALRKGTSAEPVRLELILGETYPDVAPEIKGACMSRSMRAYTISLRPPPCLSPLSLFLALSLLPL